MLYIIAPFETENFSKNISSRNLEFANVYNGRVKILGSLFDHRYKRYNSIEKTKSFLKKVNELVSFIHIPTTPYYTNVSILRLFSNFLFAFNMFVYLVLFTNKKDKVMINSIPPEVCFFASLASKIKGFKLIMDTRDIWPDALVANGGLISKVFAVYCNIFYKLSDKKRFSSVFYVAKSFDSWLNKNNFLSEKQFVPLGFDLNRWVDVSYLNSVFGKKLLYIGYLSMQFDLTDYIRFVNENDGWELHVIGGGAKLDHYKEVSHTKNVIFYGMTEPKEIPHLVNNISPDISLLPMTVGAKALMPNKLFDYLAIGCPILVTGSKDAGDFVTENGFGWYCNEISQVNAILETINFNSLRAIEERLRERRSLFSMQALYKDKIG